MLSRNLNNDALSAKRPRIDVTLEQVCRVAPATKGRNIEATSPPLSPPTRVASPTADTAATTIVAEQIDRILNSMNAKRTHSLAFDVTRHDLDAQLDALAKARHGTSPRRRWRFVTAVDPKKEKEKDAAVALLSVAQQQP